MDLDHTWQKCSFWETDTHAVRAFGAVVFYTWAAVSSRWENLKLSFILIFLSKVPVHIHEGFTRAVKPSDANKKHCHRPRTQFYKAKTPPKTTKATSPNHKTPLRTVLCSLWAAAYWRVEEKAPRVGDSFCHSSRETWGNGPEIYDNLAFKKEKGKKWKGGVRQDRFYTREEKDYGKSIFITCSIFRIHPRHGKSRHQTVENLLGGGKIYKARSGGGFVQAV